MIYLSITNIIGSNVIENLILAALEKYVEEDTFSKLTEINDRWDFLLDIVHLGTKHNISGAYLTLIHALMRLWLEVDKETDLDKIKLTILQDVIRLLREWRERDDNIFARLELDEKHFWINARQSLKIRVFEWAQWAATWDIEWIRFTITFAILLFMYEEWNNVSLFQKLLRFYHKHF